MSQSLRHTIIAWAMVSCGASAFAQLSFSGAVNYALPERPDGVVSADFDRDGDKDLAVTRDNPDRVSLLFNTAGFFGAPIDYPTGAGTGAGDMAVADFDGNGFPDIAVSLHNINSVRFFMNSGGVLTPGALVSVGANPRHLATGDLDGDGDADVVVVNRDGNTLFILWNSGTGTFTSSVVPAGIEPRAVAMADLNGDTRLDLVFSNHRDRTITVLFNQGSGAFGGATNYSVGGNVRPDGLAVGDLDNHSDECRGVEEQTDPVGISAGHREVLITIPVGVRAADAVGSFGERIVDGSREPQLCESRSPTRNHRPSDDGVTQ